MDITRLVDSEKGLVDRRIFADPYLYELELERVFGRSWLFVGHESQIAKQNDFAANYMAEDPVLITRDAKGNIHTFLNMCRHRGNRICRADQGNAPSFMCTYHGWTFSTDGKLVGVPGFKEAYFEELDRSKWGLVEARTTSYKGLIFATWDSQSPSLIDYLGDAAWYVDLIVDRREGGTELIGGVHKWVMDFNWKMGADNFIGDGYHTRITHASMGMAGINRGVTQNVSYAGGDRGTVSPGNGHGIIGGHIGDAASDQSTERSRFTNAVQEYAAIHRAEIGKRLGPARENQGNMGIGTLFPNFTWHNSPMIRVWHPRGPLKTEVWSYCIVDKLAPEEIKQDMRHAYEARFGPAGNMEVDDANNWAHASASGKYKAGQPFPMNLQMSLGHESYSEIIPGKLGPSVSETNQRTLYARWQEMIAAESWNQISISPRTRQF